MDSSALQNTYLRCREQEACRKLTSCQRPAVQWIKLPSTKRWVLGRRIGGAQQIRCLAMSWRHWHSARTAMTPQRSGCSRPWSACQADSLPVCPTLHVPLFISMRRCAACWLCIDDICNIVYTSHFQGLRYGLHLFRPETQNECSTHESRLACHVNHCSSVVYCPQCCFLQ